MRSEGPGRAARFAVALAVVGWVLAAGGVAKGEALLGVPAPSFVLDDLAGRTWTLEDLRGGGVLLLGFGSVFCAACQETLSQLEATRREFGPRGLRIAAVNVDGAKAARAVTTVTRRLEVGYPVLLDGDGAVSEAYGVDVIPFLVLLDAGGTVRAVHRGGAADLAVALDLETAVGAGR